MLSLKDKTNTELKDLILDKVMWIELYRNRILMEAKNKTYFVSCEKIRADILRHEYTIHACKLILWQRELAWRSAMHAHMATLKYEANDNDDVRYGGCLNG